MSQLNMKELYSTINEKTLKFETAFVSFGGTNVSRIIRCAVEALIEFESSVKLYLSNFFLG